MGVLVKLGNAAEITTGAINNLYDKEPSDGSSSIRLLAGSAITDEGVVNYGELQQVWVKQGKDVSRFLLKNGDVVLLARGSAIRAGLINQAQDNQGLLASANLMIIRPDHGKLYSEVLVSYLNSSLGQAKLSGISKGAVIKSVPASSLRELEIPVPLMEKQEQIAALYHAGNEAHMAVMALAMQQKSAIDAKILNLLHQGEL